MHSTDDLDDEYFGSGTRLRYSIRKHGKENHAREILEFCSDRKSLKKRETEVINEDVLLNPLCMNLMIGGEGGFISDEQQKRRASAAGTASALSRIEHPERHQNRSLKTTEELKQRHTAGLVKYDTFTNKKHTEEAKKRIGEKNAKKQLANKNSQYGTCWITNEKQNKKIHKDDLIPEGWRLGRVIKI